MKTKNTARFKTLDAIRGFAIILMIAFHIAYDLTIFNFLKINFQNDQFWFVLPRVIVFIFLVCSGISLRLAHKKSNSFSAFSFRLGKLIAVAAAISLTTYFFFPTKWIHFGIIHCVALSSILALPLVRYPKISLVLAMIIQGARFVFGYNLQLIPKIPDVVPMDFIPIYPWFGIVLLGIYLETLRIHAIQLPNNWPFSKLAFLGRHSLKIYLIHQPIIFGTVYLLNILLH